jgi:hypothetical protein
VTNRECSWSARSDAEWLRLSTPVDGLGDATLGFSVAGNEHASARGAAILVNDLRLQISQDGKACQFRLSSNREQVETGGGDRTIQVIASDASCGWTAAASVPWIRIAAGQRGNGNGAVTFHVDPFSGSPRTATLTVAGVVVLVEQGTGCSYSIGATAFTVSQSGGPVELAVTAPPGCAWAAQSHVDWMTIDSGGTGSGPGVVAVRVAPTAGPSRMGTLTVAGRTITVEQSPGCDYSFEPSIFGAPASGGAGVIAVRTGQGCGWFAASGASWITITGNGTGSGSGQLQFVVAANQGPGRQASLTVSGKTLAVAQASGCTYSITPTDRDVPAAGGTGAVSVATGGDCPWTASSNAGWITFAAPFSVGSGQVQFEAASNSGPPRLATVTIANQTFTVRQASPCTFTLAPTFAVYGGNGGGGAILVIVSGPCTWTSVTTHDWIRITNGTSGLGDGLVQFSIPPSTAARTGTIVIAGQTFTVTQTPE